MDSSAPKEPSTARYHTQRGARVMKVTWPVIWYSRDMMFPSIYRPRDTRTTSNGRRTTDHTSTTSRQNAPPTTNAIMSWFPRSNLPIERPRPVVTTPLTRGQGYIVMWYLTRWRHMAGYITDSTVNMEYWITTQDTITIATIITQVCIHSNHSNHNNTGMYT